MVSSVVPTSPAVTERGASVPSIGPAGMSRLAGLCALGFIALLVGDGVGVGGPNPTTIPVERAVPWALQHQQVVAVHGFVAGLEDTLFALFTVLLIGAIGIRGPLAIIAYLGVGVSMATGWVLAGVMYALAKLAHGGGADAGIQVLFALGNAMLDADAIAVALAVGCIGTVFLRSRALPVALGWWAVALAALYALDVPLTLAGAGFFDPILLGLAMLWLLVMGITLLVRPIRAGAARSRTAVAMSGGGRMAGAVD